MDRLKKKKVFYIVSIIGFMHGCTTSWT